IGGSGRVGTQIPLIRCTAHQRPRQGCQRRIRSPHRPLPWSARGRNFCDQAGQHYCSDTPEIQFSKEGGIVMSYLEIPANDNPSRIRQDIAAKLEVLQSEFSPLAVLSMTILTGLVDMLGNAS